MDRTSVERDIFDLILKAKRERELDVHMLTTMLTGYTIRYGMTEYAAGYEKGKQHVSR